MSSSQSNSTSTRTAQSNSSNRHQPRAVTLPYHAETKPATTFWGWEIELPGQSAK